MPNNQNDQEDPIVVDDGGNLTANGTGTGAATAMEKPQEGASEDITKM
jgi:hypothetical protein